MSGANHLEVFFIDDDEEVLKQMKELEPKELAGAQLDWTYCSRFDLAMEVLSYRRFDLVITDIYRDREGKEKTIEEGDVKARDLVRQIRDLRFCPIVLFSDGKLPDGLIDDPFISFVSKTGDPEALEKEIKAHLSTGLVQIVRKLHDKIDRGAGSYVWDFVSSNWDAHFIPEKLKFEKLQAVVRKRAAVMLANVKDDDHDPNLVSPVDYYLIPPISEHIQLGSLLESKTQDGEYRIVVTPHCHLTIQPGQDEPRAERVLTVVGEKAKPIAHGLGWGTKDPTKKIAGRIKIPAKDVRKPAGRDCFFPGFATIPDLYFDLMHLESLEYKTCTTDFKHIADISSPFAEALQANITSYYSDVGLPELKPEDFAHLVPEEHPSKKPTEAV